MSLQDDSNALRKDLEAKIGDNIKFIDRETEALLQSGIITNSLQVGQKAPDFTLPNATGGEVSLSSHLKKRPVVLRRVVSVLQSRIESLSTGFA